ncbi:heme A synthase [Polaromonas sp. JS666]|uniref:COX15/CtaA family protein n=1 Tax=Polaromonas sp. (strain JS666 / ATCC BAA-500) TaxID=296591 RepID=UPI000884E907|nr:COX15/CtaA family protein [Polaromonas sp. JS666]SDN11220.1 cytochrome c oxidase assembly protein subunit 15 [Polaromonas sp. JS666]
MAAQNLYDLSPALRLMIMGLVVALGPLAWVWAHNKNAPVAQRLRVLTLVTLFLTFDLVIFGAFTRLTDSGLGCPDWPGCYGSASPVGAQMHIEAAQTAMPTGPVTHSKAWIEMVHRYLATGVGVLILTLTVTSWLERKRIAVSPWWPTVTLVWVCLQGAFGALTVTMKLFPAIVTLHLLGGLVLLALLRAQSLRYAGLQAPPAPGLGKGLRLAALAAFALLWLQIALGGWVSTNYAVLACTDFPGCQNSLWPAMDFRQGFTLWRELGAGHDGANISFQALTAIHYVHRLTAYLVFAVFLALAFFLHRVPAFRAPARWLAGLIVLQAVTGISNAVLGWPLLAAVMHTGGAAALVIVLGGVVFSGRGGPSVPHASKLNA